jgi:hypothetical protein
MKPQIGQYVQVMLQYGYVIEGYVENWTDEQSVLRSISNKSLVIIPHTSSDIVAIKIMQETPQLKEENSNTQELENQIEEVKKLPSQDETRLLKLAELRKQLAEQDRKIISDKLKDHNISGTQKVQYGQPGFLPKQSVK